MKAKVIKVSDHMDDKSIAYWKLDKNQDYVLKKIYFRNGEHWAVTDKGEWPSIFFNIPY